MDGAMEPITDREIMIRLDGNVSSLKESIDRFAKSLEELEQTKVKDHELRLNTIEKWVSEWSGAYKIVAIVALILGLIATFKSFKIPL